MATEPDPHMFRRLASALPSASRSVRLHRATADALPVEDGWADTVVTTLVLCSVPEQGPALAEVVRVLKPGGLLLFYEHVRGDEWLARWQDRLEGPWGWFAGGCHPNRDTVAAIEAAGMVIERIERFDLPGTGVARPHVCGAARKG